MPRASNNEPHAGNVMRKEPSHSASARADHPENLQAYAAHTDATMHALSESCNITILCPGSERSERERVTCARRMA
eukprot:5277591-Alexandrium_andersonii.AAC.1